MERKNNITKFNRDIKFNVASIIIALIFLYVIIVIVISINKEPITTYKVNKTDINNNIIVEGLAIREEIVLNSDKSGYVCYYIRDGEKVKKNSTVCTIDETGQLYNSITDAESYDSLLTREDYNEIRNLISLYKVSYNDISFYNSYNFENNVNNKVLELTNEILMQQTESSSGGVSLSAIQSPESGLITYYIDGYENYNISSISASDFDKSNYKKETLKTGDIITSGTPVVKVIPSETWNIIMPVTDDQISAISSKYSEDDNIQFKINNSSYTLSMPFEIINNSGDKYLNISLNKFMLNYISERFVSIEIILEDDIGLKVPASALTKKDVYQIPVSYLSAGGNQSSNNRFNVQVMNENNEITIKQIVPTIYMSDEENCYVDPLAFDEKDVLIDIDTNDTLPVSLIPKVSIDGVYSANKGIAEFTKVTIIKTIDEFALVESDESLNIFDNIIFDSSKVTENQIIY